MTLCDGWHATDGGSYLPNPLSWPANGYCEPRGMVGVDRRPYADSTAYCPVAGAVCEAVRLGGAPYVLVRYP